MKVKLFMTFTSQSWLTQCELNMQPLHNLRNEYEWFSEAYSKNVKSLMTRTDRVSSVDAELLKIVGIEIDL